MKPRPCTLCAQEAQLYFHDLDRQWIYYLCPSCDLRFLDPGQYLNPQQERERYELHENNVNDPRYLNFVNPLVEVIKRNHSADSLGLDFGCGENSGLGHSLRQAGYTLQSYDPFFHNQPSALEQTYDFVAAVEVVEHFYRPAQEFDKLKSLLKPHGHLGLMTQIFLDNSDFENWYYRRDPTHVCFYSKQTLRWIQNHFEFSHLEIKGDRVVWLTN